MQGGDLCVSEIGHAWKSFLLLSQELLFDERPAPSHNVKKGSAQMANIFPSAIGLLPWPDKHENKGGKRVTLDLNL